MTNTLCLTSNGRSIFHLCFVHTQSSFDATLQKVESTIRYRYHLEKYLETQTGIAGDVGRHVLRAAGYIMSS